MPRIIRNAIRCRKCGDIIESETVHDFKFAAAGHVPWTEALIIFVGAETLEIGKNCPMWKRWKTTARWFDFE